MLRSTRARTTTLAIGVVVALASASASPETGAAQAVVIGVTTSADAIDGTITSVQGLLQNPGPDGVSLREALHATNLEPGHYEIRFAPALAGATIRVGSATGGGLPALTGGGVSIDGDIDGNGRPDVVLRNEITTGSQCGLCAFVIASGGNRLHALGLESFTAGVFFDPLSPATNMPLTHQTHASNVVSNLAMNDIAEDGIVFSSLHGRSECAASPTACSGSTAGSTHSLSATRS